MNTDKKIGWIVSWETKFKLENPNIGDEMELSTFFGKMKFKIEQISHERIRVGNQHYIAYLRKSEELDVWVHPNTCYKRDVVVKVEIV